VDLDALRYGDLLTAPVSLACGPAKHDGYYSVNTVSHTINRKNINESPLRGKRQLGKEVSYGKHGNIVAKWWNNIDP
jgi:hypothetical protein